MIWEIYETKLTTTNCANRGRICDRIPLPPGPFGLVDADFGDGTAGVEAPGLVSSLKDDVEDLAIVGES